MDILLDEVTHDVVWNNGPLTKEFTTQPFTQTVAQRLKIRLLSFKSEWFMDINYGVPYWQEILGLKPSKARVDRILQQQILLERGVKEIVSFSSTLINRQYSLKFQVKVLSGEVTAPILISPVI
jgi:hypothetical protein